MYRQIKVLYSTINQTPKKTMYSIFKDWVSRCPLKNLVFMGLIP